MNITINKPGYYSEKTFDKVLGKYNNSYFDRIYFALETNLQILLIEKLYNNYPELAGFTLQVDRKNWSKYKISLFLFNEDLVLYEPSELISKEWEKHIFHHISEYCQSNRKETSGVESFLVFSDKNFKRELRYSAYKDMVRNTINHDIRHHYFEYVDSLQAKKFEKTECLNIFELSIDMVCYNVEDIIKNQGIVLDAKNCIKHYQSIEKFINYYKIIEQKQCDILYFNSSDKPTFYSIGDSLFDVNTDEPYILAKDLIRYFHEINNHLNSPSLYSLTGLTYKNIQSILEDIKIDKISYEKRKINNLIKVEQSQKQKRL